MSANLSAYKEIEAQLDACARRIRELEDYLRAEIEQQHEDVRTLRSQLRRTIKATTGAQRSAPDAAPVQTTAPPAAAPAAFEHHAFVDPFESVLLDASEETDTAAQTQPEPTAGQAEPVVEQAEPIIEQAEPIAAEPVADPFDDLLPPLPADDEPADEPAAPSGAQSAFNMLLDWSDFEPDASVEDAPPSRSANGTHAGNGAAAPRALLPPTLRADRPGPSARDERNLTAVSGIDDAMQASLHRIGITRLDEIAGWHLADACRIAEQLGTVSEREVIDRWVPEAQSILFDLFQQRLRQARFRDER